MPRDIVRAHWEIPEPAGTSLMEQFLAFFERLQPRLGSQRTFLAALNSAG
jgi:hypothetical protein